MELQTKDGEIATVLDLHNYLQKRYDLPEHIISMTIEMNGCDEPVRITATFLATFKSQA